MHIASQRIAYVRLQPDCAWLLALGHYLRCGPYTPRRGLYALHTASRFDRLGRNLTAPIAASCVSQGL
jgi:hypothetical protein